MAETAAGGGGGGGGGGGDGFGSGSAPAVLSLPPPRPKSPPDLYGRRKDLARLKMLEREKSLLEEELKLVEGLQPASRCCKEVVEYVAANGDPLIPTNKKISKTCRLWKWLCGSSCLSLSWICCYTPCSINLKIGPPKCNFCCGVPHCCSCITCSLPKCSLKCKPTRNHCCPKSSCFKDCCSCKNCCSCCNIWKCFSCSDCCTCRCSCPKCTCPKCSCPSCSCPDCSCPSCSCPKCSDVCACRCGCGCCRGCFDCIKFYCYCCPNNCIC